MRLPVCCWLLLLLVAVIRGQDVNDFDLGDYFDNNEKTTKPQPGPGGGIADAPVDVTKKPPAKPQPGIEDVDDTTTKPQPGPGGGIVDAPVDVTKKPPAKPQPGIEDVDEFDLGDALGGHNDQKPPTVKPQPGQGGGGVGRELDDSDLLDAGAHHGDPSGPDNRPEGHDKPHGRALHPSADADGKGEGNQSVVAGIVSAVAVAAVGAVSSFIAYQKKKLCFKGATEDPENVNMESHKGDQSEPQVQSTLLAK